MHVSANFTRVRLFSLVFFPGRLLSQTDCTPPSSAFTRTHHHSQIEAAKLAHTFICVNLTALLHASNKQTPTCMYVSPGLGVRRLALFEGKVLHVQRHEELVQALLKALSSELVVHFILH